MKGIDGVEVDPPLPDIRTAIIARITVPHPTNTILLRCELDALKFKEKSGLPFSSTNEGIHHACGHDGHMASLLVALRYTAKHRDQLRRNVIFCFQPGEEGKAGASKLFKAKPDLLDHVDECYAIHFMNAAYPGTIALGKGAVTALTSSLAISIEGKSAHCMMPNVGVDANFIGCTLVTQLYSLIGMKVPPLEGATLVVKQVAGGGTVAKALTASTRKKLEASIKGLIVDENEKSFAGEDFCEFSERKPSCYIAVGSAPADSIDPSNKESKFPLHSPFHKLNEEVFKTSTKIWAAIIFT
ncbi:uncharacterized protein LOC116245569 [Nymphaea colorata]|uniref:uncharacterized protein LOC116245569 n=1 Tax=Nymphaea colorata TaxID=210225 RepID=UPI00129E5921|nr:uncharacterized protein LOC116245569 [Nymphaea colorata]